jgi:hypothetical protein
VYKQVNRRIVDQPAVVSGIQQFAEVKILGVWFNHKLFFKFFNRLLAMVSQRFFLLNCFRRQGLDSVGVNVVFNAVKMSKFLYACQAFSGFLCVSDLNRFQASLNKAHRYTSTAVKYDITNLF